MIRIVKNSGGSDVVINDLGTIVPAGGQYDFANGKTLVQLSESKDLYNLLSDGTLTLNTGGSTDLSVADAKRVIRMIFWRDTYKQAEDETSTTNTKYVQKLRHSLQGVTAGTYKIEWCYEWKMSNHNFAFKARLQLNDTTTLADTAMKSYDGKHWLAASGFMFIDLTDGNHYIDLDYCSEGSNKAAHIRRARIAVRREEG